MGGQGNTRRRILCAIATTHTRNAMNQRSILVARATLLTALAAAAIALPASIARAQQGPSAPASPDAPATPAAPAPAAPGGAVAPSMPRMPAAPKFRELPVEGEKPSPKDIFAKHVDATGGATAWESKTSMTSAGSIEIPAVQVKGTLKMCAMAPDRVVVESELPGIGKTAQGFDGTVGWSIDPMRGPALMDANQVAQIKRDGNFRKDLALAQDPGASEVIGLFEFEGTPCWQVKVDGVGDQPASQFYARDTGLMRGMAMSAATPMGNLPVILVMDDYRDFGDVKVSARSTTKVMGQTQVMTIDTVDWNAAKDTDFELPAPIKALAAASAAQASPASPSGAPAAAPPTGTK